MKEGLAYKSGIYEFIEAVIAWIVHDSSNVSLYGELDFHLGKVIYHAHWTTVLLKSRYTSQTLSCFRNVEHTMLHTWTLMQVIYIRML